MSYEKNYWMIPMDFVKYPFKKMKKEWNENGKILWQAAGTPAYCKKTGEYEVKEGQAKRLKSGDVIYFYIIKLPIGKSRVLLRGEVIDKAFPISKSKVYSNNSDDEKMINGFSIGKLTTLEKKNLTDHSYFTIEDFIEKMGIIEKIEEIKKIKSKITPRGKNWPNSVKGNLYPEVIKLLEASFKSSGWEKDIDQLISFFEKESFL